MSLPERVESHAASIAASTPYRTGSDAAYDRRSASGPADGPPHRTRDPGSAPCWAPSRPPPCSASTATPSPSRSTAAPACRRSPSSARPTARAVRPAGGVRAALLSSGCSWPQQRVTVNLAPPSVRKIGAGLDLAIAVAILVASEQVDAVGGGGARVPRRARARRLGPAGRRHALPHRGPRRAGGRAPGGQRRRGPVGGRSHDPRRHHVDRGRGVPARRAAVARRSPAAGPRPLPRVPDLADVRGQPVGRFALEVAAAGGHHLLLLGPPGRRQDDARLAAARPAPAAHRPSRPRDHPHPLRRRSRAAAGRAWCARHRSGRPTTAPRRSRWSAAAAPTMRPGEISAACNGVLFLDELAEFAQHVLDALRQPLEEGVVRVARAAGTVTFPARFLLVAAMNPCPCGYGGRPGGCRCTDGARARYQRRLSGPLLDRFDLRVEVTRPSVSDLMGTDRSEPTAAVRERVLAARARRGRSGRGHQRRHPASTGSTSSPRSTPTAPTCWPRRSRAAASRPAACTGCGASPARSPTCRTRPSDVVTAAHVAIALSLRVDAAPSTPGRPGAHGMTDATRPRATRSSSPATRRSGRAASPSCSTGAAPRRAGRRSAATRPPIQTRALAAHDDAGRRHAAAVAPSATRTRCDPIPSAPPCCSPRATSPRWPTSAWRSSARAGAPVRRRVRARARPRAHRRRRRGGVRPRARHRRRRPPRRARGGRPSRSAVVGSGLDVVYPAKHRDLWGRVREAGLLLTRGTARLAARRLALPRPQPDHRRAVAPRGRGRVARGAADRCSR